MAGALFIARHLLALLFLTATAWVAGRLLLGKVGGHGRWERFGLAMALGLAALGHFGLLLGFLGVLSRGAVIVVVVGILLLGLGVWWRARRGPSPPTPLPPPSHPRRERGAPTWLRKHSSPFSWGGERGRR